MNLEVSGFFAPADIYDAGKGGFSLIHRSEGGFFELYRGERAGHFRVFKCLKQEFRGSLIHETMLQKEFEISFSLRHPAIRETYAFLQLDGLGSCIEMEWIDGCTLDEYLQNNRADEAFFRQAAGSLCDALSYIHAHQIIHRDIKPSNILVTHQGRVLKLIDFSLADSDSFSMFKQPAGTRSYAAPEVIAGHAADVRSDLYSLGKVLAEVRSGHCKALRKCTEEDPSRRYASTEELKAALLHGRVVWPWVAAAILAMTVAGVVRSLDLARDDRGSSARDDRGSGVEVTPDDMSGTGAPETAVEARSLDITRDDKGSGVGKDRKGREPAGKAVREDDVDAIFRQATELFE
jgi:hypothetical protein